MLVMLAVAGAVGVIAIFMSTFVTGRVAITALISAACLGAAIPASKMLGTDKGRWGGLVWLGSDVLALALFLSATWIRFLGSWDTEWQLALTGMIVMLGGGVSGALLGAVRTPGMGATSVTGVVTLLASSVSFIAAIWIDLQSFDEHLALTGAHAMVAGLVIAVSLVGLGASMRWWQWAGVIGGAVQLSLGLLGTWLVHSGDPSWFVLAGAVGASVAYANVVTRVKAGDAGIWAKLAGIGGMASTCGCVTLLTFMTETLGTSEPDFLVRLAGASGLLTACATMALVILKLLNRRKPETVGNAEEIASVQLTCPHCGKKQQMAVGESACEGCGLEFSLRVREPRCGTCGYPLMGVRGGKCPECGGDRKKETQRQSSEETE